MGIIGKEEVSLSMTRTKSISNSRMLHTLQAMGVNTNTMGVLSLLILRYTPNKIIRLAQASKIKIARYGEGSIIGNFSSSGRSAKTAVKKISPNDIFSVFFALITRGIPEVIKCGENALGNAELLRRGRDSIANGKRVELYEWIMASTVENMSLWKYRMNPTWVAASVIIKKLQSEFSNCKAIIEITDRLLFSRKRKNNIFLEVGGCSLNNLNVTAREVSCCYFFQGQEQDALIQWIASPDHIFLYIKREGIVKHPYLGVVMLFFADRGKTIVIDSIEAMRYEIDSYSGWREWLWKTILEYGRSMGAERIIVNKDVAGDVAREFVTWVIKYHMDYEKCPYLPKMTYNQLQIQAEFNPQIRKRYVSYSLLDL